MDALALYKLDSLW